ncbi:MAG: DUF4097 family beta strand repeat-containing protein [Terriglobales bacterium]
MNRRRLAVLLVVLSLFALPLLASEEGTFDRTLKVTGPVDLDVNTGSGSITVSRGSDGQVVVHATIRTNDGWFSGDPSARIKAIQNNPPIDQSGNVIHIGHSNDSDLLRNISISYDVQVPATTKLQAHSGSGHIRITGVNSPVEATTGSGGIDASQIASDVRLQTGSGGIGLDNISGQVRAHTGSGGIHGTNIGGYTTVNTAAKFQGKALPLASSGSTGPGASNPYLDFETGSGGIRLDNVAGELRARAGSGTIEVQGQQTGDWEMSSGSGGIHVRLPDNAKFTLMARTSSGTVNTDFPITVQGSVNRHELNGPVNGGGPSLNLRTGSGGIRIEK